MKLKHILGLMLVSTMIFTGCGTKVSEKQPEKLPNVETPPIVETPNETEIEQKPVIPEQKTDTPEQNPNVPEQNPNVPEQKQNPTEQKTNTPEQKPVIPEQKSEVTPAQRSSTPTPKAVVNDKFMAQVESMIFNKVNEERTKAGVPVLKYSTTMEKYARMKSQDMGDRQYFDHKDPQGNLMTAKMQNDGVRFNSWGENIAYIGGVSDATALGNEFMTNWMNSPGHRQNILSTNYSSIGVGVYKVGNTVYATQEFYK